VKTVGLRTSESELSEPKRRESTAHTGRGLDNGTVERRRVEPSLVDGRLRNALSDSDLFARLSAMVVGSVSVGTMLKCSRG
jgi:hypothetical protein